MTTTKTPKAGDVLHVLKAISVVTSGPDPLAYADGEVLQRGTTFVLTDKLLDGNRNWISGETPFDNAGQENSAFGLGAWPERAEVWEHGSVEHARAREAARAEAFAIPNEVKRGQALREVEKRFGPVITSTTLETLGPR